MCFCARDGIIAVLLHVEAYLGFYTACLLLQLLAKLTDRRLKVDMELSALGSDKRNNQDIFKHCRQFERTFQTMLNEANVAFKIRAVVEGHLPEMLYKIPIEKRFNKNYTREICREADGYQPHLVSPERGIKRLVVEAMKLTEDHVHRFVDEIHIVLLETVKEAARNTMTLEVSGGVNSNVNYEYLRLKGFENAVIIAATQALEEWRADAHKVASMMVQMECDYVTPSFFRELERQWQEENTMQGNTLENGMESGSPSQQYDADAMSDDSEAISPRESQEQQQDVKEQGASRRGWKDGWMEKNSSNLSAPVESWRWQRRWFMLSVESGVLLYCSSPEDVGKKQPKVAMNLRECLVEDVSEDASSLMIKLQNKNPSQKSRQVLILRVSSVEEKHEWMNILRSAALPKPQNRDQQQQQQQQQQGNGAQRLQRPMPSQRGLMSSAQPDSDKGLFGRTVDKVSNQFSRLTGLGNSKMGDMTAPGTIQDLDQYYEKLGRFCGIYARMTYDRMAKTVPKAIILCQVIRSRDRLLDQLFQYLSTRTEKEIEFMLLEDPSVGRRRAAASQASKDIADCLEEVRKIVDIRNTQEVRKEEEKVSVRTLLLAGAYPLVPSNAVPKSTDPGRLYGEFTPNALVGGDARQQLAPASKEGKTEDKEEGKEKPAAKEKEGMKPRRAAPPPPPGS